jgi:hypothetical protein
MPKQDTRTLRESVWQWSNVWRKSVGWSWEASFRLRYTRTLAPLMQQLAKAKKSTVTHYANSEFRSLQEACTVLLVTHDLEETFGIGMTLRMLLWPRSLLRWTTLSNDSSTPVTIRSTTPKPLYALSIYTDSATSPLRERSITQHLSLVATRAHPEPKKWQDAGDWGARHIHDDAPFTLWDGINRQYCAPMKNEFGWIRKKFGGGKFSQSGQASQPKARAMPLLSGSRRIVTNFDSGLCTLVSYGRRSDTWVVRLHMFVGEYISQSRTDRESNHLLSLSTWFC